MGPKKKSKERKNTETNKNGNTTYQDLRHAQVQDRAAVGPPQETALKVATNVQALGPSMAASLSLPGCSPMHQFLNLSIFQNHLESLVEAPSPVSE